MIRFNRSTRTSGSVVRAQLGMLFLLFGLWGCGLGMDAEARLERATKSFDEGEYRAAMIDVKSVLQEQPDNLQARLLLGRVSIVLNDPFSAEKELRRAVELGMPMGEVVLDLAKALLLQGAFQQIVDEIQPELSADADKQQAIFRYRGDAYLGLGKPQDARQAFSKALEWDAGDNGARIGVATSYLAERKFDETEAMISQVLDADASFVPAWIASGRVSLLQQDYPGAAEKFTRATKLATEQGNQGQLALALSSLGEAQLSSKTYAEALGTIDQLLAITGEAIGPLFLAARVAFANGQLDVAQDRVEKVLRANPDFRQAQLLLGALHLSKGNLGQAEMYLSRVVSGQPGNADARRLLAETRLKQRKAREAVAALEPLASGENADLRVLAMAGRASMEIGDYDAAVGYLEKSLQADDSNTNLQLDLAAAHIAAGDLDQAQAILIHVSGEEAQEYRREVLGLFVTVRSGQQDEAMSQADRILERWPDNPQLLNLVGGLQAASGRLDRAKLSFEKARGLSPGQPLPLLNLGRLEASAGNYPGAEQYFLDAAQLEPGNVMVLMALAEIALRQQKLDESVKWLEKARESDSQSIQPRLALARYYMAQKEFGSAESMATEAIGISDQNAEAYSLLGMARLANRTFTSAIDSFKQAQRIDPDNPLHPANQARALIGLDRKQNARDLLAQTFSAHPDSAIVAVLLAQVESALGDFDAALAVAERLKSGDPDSAAGYVLEGEVLVAMERWQDADRAYGEALKIASDRNVVLRAHKVRNRGGLKQAEAPLEAFLTSNPDDIGVRQVLAQAYFQAGKTDKAVAEYERVLEKEPEDAVALNNLAWILFEKGDPRAAELGKKAAEAAPKSGAVLDTYGWILVSQGNAVEGTDFLRKAVELSPDAPTIRYHLAVGLNAQGKYDDALAVLDGLFTENAEFSEKALAAKLRDELRSR